MKFLQPPVLPALAADPASPAVGTLYVHTTAGLKFYDGAWSTVADLESAQTISGMKTFANGLVLANSGLSGPPRIAGQLAYDGTSLRFYSGADRTVMDLESGQTSVGKTFTTDVTLSGTASLIAGGDVQAANRSMGRGGMAAGYAQITAASATTANSSTTVDVGVQATVTVPAGRRIRITAYCHFSSTVASDRAALYIREGTTALQAHYSPTMVSANVSYSAVIQAIVNSPSAGSHTYKISMNRLSGTGTITMTAGTGNPTYIVVEDLGPDS